MKDSLPPPTPPLDQRSADILDSVRIAFAEKGFDGASMQDLARAAGMSVGNFYRYFPSKSAIVEALVSRDLQEVEAEFAAIIGSPDPMDALRIALRRHITTDHCGKDGHLWAEMTAAALRKPEIGDITRKMEAGITGYLTAVFAHVTGLSRPEALERYAPHAMLVVMLVKASAMQPGQTDEQRENLTDLILRTIDRTLSEIVAEAPKG